MTLRASRSSASARVKKKPKASADSAVPNRTPPPAPAQAGEAADRSLKLGPLKEFIGYPLRRAQIAVFDNFIEVMGEAGLRPGQFSTLVVIDANPGSKQTDVAAALGIQGTNFVAMINGLEKRGLVERRALDRRSYALHLSPAGKKLLTRCLELQLKHEAHYDDILGPGGRAQLLELLAKINDAYEAEKAPPDRFS